MTKTRVYIAGPIHGSGTVEVNIRRAIDAAHVLMDRGFAPYIPHLHCFMEIVEARPVKDWMDLNLAYLRICHALLRLPGESPHSEVEMAEAFHQGVRVYLSLDTLLCAEKPYQNLELKL